MIRLIAFWTKSFRFDLYETEYNEILEYEDFWSVNFIKFETTERCEITNLDERKEIFFVVL